MARTSRDSFENLERLRQNLESNVEKLSTSLQYWQTWEAEYEGLRDELEASRTDSSEEQMLGIGTDIGGDIVNERGGSWGLDLD